MPLGGNAEPEGRGKRAGMPIRLRPAEQTPAGRHCPRPPQPQPSAADATAPAAPLVSAASVIRDRKRKDRHRRTLCVRLAIGVVLAGIVVILCAVYVPGWTPGSHPVYSKLLLQRGDFPETDRRRLHLVRHADADPLGSGTAATETCFGIAADPVCGVLSSAVYCAHAVWRRSHLSGRPVGSHDDAYKPGPMPESAEPTRLQMALLDRRPPRTLIMALYEDRAVFQTEQAASDCHHALVRQLTQTLAAQPLPEQSVRHEPPPVGNERSVFIAGRRSDSLSQPSTALQKIIYAFRTGRVCAKLVVLVDGSLQKSLEISAKLAAAASDRAATANNMPLVGQLIVWAMPIGAAVRAAGFWITGTSPPRLADIKSWFLLSARSVAQHLSEAAWFPVAAANEWPVWSVLSRHFGPHGGGIVLYALAAVISGLLIAIGLRRLRRRRRAARMQGDSRGSAAVVVPPSIAPTDARAADGTSADARHRAGPHHADEHQVCQGERERCARKHQRARQHARPAGDTSEGSDSSTDRHEREHPSNVLSVSAGHGDGTYAEINGVSMLAAVTQSPSPSPSAATPTTQSVSLDAMPEPCRLTGEQRPSRKSGRPNGETKHQRHRSDECTATCGSGNSESDAACANHGSRWGSHEDQQQQQYGRRNDEVPTVPVTSGSTQPATGTMTLARNGRRQPAGDTDRLDSVDISASVQAPSAPSAPALPSSAAAADEGKASTATSVPASGIWEAVSRRRSVPRHSEEGTRTREAQSAKPTPSVAAAATVGVDVAHSSRMATIAPTIDTIGNARGRGAAKSARRNKLVASAEPDGAKPSSRGPRRHSCSLSVADFIEQRNGLLSIERPALGFRRQGELGRSSEASLAVPHPTIRVFCWNCGCEGHEGTQCSAPTLDELLARHHDDPFGKSAMLHGSVPMPNSFSFPQLPVMYYVPVDVANDNDDRLGMLLPVAGAAPWLLVQPSPMELASAAAAAHVSTSASPSPVSSATSTTFSPTLTALPSLSSASPLPSSAAQAPFLIADYDTAFPVLSAERTASTPAPPQSAHAGLAPGTTLVAGSAGDGAHPPNASPRTATAPASSSASSSARSADAHADRIVMVDSDISDGTSQHSAAVLSDSRMRDSVLVPDHRGPFDSSASSTAAADEAHRFTQSVES